jgi:pimeloyl-ACP methyl ester carboxylesterase
MNNTQSFPQKWILIRGLTRSHFHWFDFKNNFQKKFQVDSVLAPELAGNGELSHLKTPKNISLCITQLKTQLPNFQQPIGIIGISLGGMIAARWAQEYPNDVSRLVLINTSSNLSPFYHRFRPSIYLNVLKAVFFSKAFAIENFILKTTSNTENWKSVFSQCVRFQEIHSIQISNLIQQLKIAGKTDLSHKPNCPVLILTAKNDRLVNYQCSLDIAAAWNTTAHIHPTAGHDLPLDDSDWILNQIQSEFKK